MTSAAASVTQAIAARPISPRRRFGAAASTPMMLARQRFAADRGENLPGVVARQLLRCEEDVRRRDLVRLRRALHRHLLPEGLDLLLRKRSGDQRGPDRSRRDAVHPD